MIKSKSKGIAKMLPKVFSIVNVTAIPSAYFFHQAFKPYSMFWGSFFLHSFLLE